LHGETFPEHAAIVVRIGIVGLLRQSKNTAHTNAPPTRKPPRLTRKRSARTLKPAVEDRYRFIEFRIYWRNRINRSDLMTQFGVSIQQASLDLNTYIAGAKRNLVYDRRAKCYRRGKSFKQRYFTPDAGQFLGEIRAVEEGYLPLAQSWFPALPDHAGTPVPARGVAPEILRAVYMAIEDRQALAVTYQSMSRPAPTERIIEPHALAYDGFRWHARAFCRNDRVFKDFLISRILETGEVSAREADPAADRDWQEVVVLEVGPHPGLSETQKRVIEMDYGMVDGTAEIPVRRALLYYALKRLGLDTDPAARRPQDQQIVLLNGDLAAREAG
jgi:hypothetical protein